VAASSGGAGARAEGVDAGWDEAKNRACSLYFFVTSWRSCQGPELPVNEYVRLEALFQASCVEEFDLPGNTSTAEVLNACANLLGGWDCGSPDGPPVACDIRGSLPAGAPCISDKQCQSGACKGTTPGVTPGGPLAGADTCGKCGAVARIGETCDEASCEKGAVCLIVDSNAKESHYACRAIVEGGAGEPCDHLTRLCAAGLYCDDSRRICAKLPSLDEACPAGLCAPALVCHAETSTCGKPGAAGDDCTRAGDRGCAAGLGCDYHGRCVAIHWAGPGEACDDTRRCLVGSCNRGFGPPAPQGTCPTTVPDGQPCTSDGDCDTLSSCLNPSAPQGVATGVCGPKTGIVCR
jgi:hypothetical protein